MSRQNNPPGQTTKNITLGKGKACICCRRRKMRCDGSHPVCRQCTTNGREMDCEYSDGINPTRTELLEERLSRLQERLEDLEGRAIGQGTQPEISRGTGSVSRLLDGITSGASSRWWDAEIPPARIAQTLVETFLHHSEQLGFALSTPRFLTALSTPFNSTTYPHKALLNVIFLWGLRISSSYAVSGSAGFNSTEIKKLQEQEQAIFERTTRHLQAQMQDDNPRRGIQAIQAEVLLASYLFAAGRALEGAYHVSAAVTLATTFGIHRIHSTTGDGSGGSETSLLRRSGLIGRRGGGVDTVEEGERIRVFWRVYELDKCWAVASGSASILQEKGSTLRIDTPWPLTMADYEAGQHGIQGSGNTTRGFLESRARELYGDSPLALSSKASLLSERGSRLASIRATSTDDPSVFDATRTLDETIVAFVSSLPQVPEDTTPANRAYFVCVHVMAYASLIYLHDSVSQNDATAYSSCVNAARLIAAVVGYLQEGEALLMTPFVTTGLTVACKVLSREVAASQSLGQSSQTHIPATPTQTETELSNIMQIMNQLRPVYPVVSAQLRSVQDAMHSMGVTL